MPDIIFILLFFFMVASFFQENPTKIKKELPKAYSKELLESNEQVSYVNIGSNPNGQYIYEIAGITYPCSDYSYLEDHIESSSVTSKVVLSADKSLPTYVINNLKEVLQKLNREKVSYQVLQE